MAGAWQRVHRSYAKRRVLLYFVHPISWHLSKNIITGIQSPFEFIFGTILMRNTPSDWRVIFKNFDAAAGWILEAICRKFYIIRRVGSWEYVSTSFRYLGRHVDLFPFMSCEQSKFIFPQGRADEFWNEMLNNINCLMFVKIHSYAIINKN